MTAIIDPSPEFFSDPPLTTFKLKIRQTTIRRLCAAAKKEGQKPEQFIAAWLERLPPTPAEKLAIEEFFGGAD